jgi:hypothetical protein
VVTENNINNHHFIAPMDENKKRLLMGGILIFFMVSSVFGVLFFGFRGGQSASSTKKYGDFKFKVSQNQWQVTIDGENLLFRYHPEDIDYIPVTQDIKNILTSTRVIHMTSDPDSPLKGGIAASQYTLSQYLALKNIFTISGFTTPSDFNVPIITCNNATAAIPVLHYRQGNRSLISKQENCIFLEGNSDFDFSRLTERLIYMLYGVIQ